MAEDQNNIEETLIKGLSHILKRTIEVNEGDQLAIAQEYREWINCITAEDFSRHEILVIDKNRFC
tara:strand:+ start:77 stop:271 length:195 start_codon:yes stop_codon:yes gene_type:complete